MVAGAHDVELDMHGALVDILLNKACQIVPALNASHSFLREAEIHQGAIGGETVIHFGQRVDDGRGAVDIVGAKIRVDRAILSEMASPALRPSTEALVFRPMATLALTE